MKNSSQPLAVKSTGLQPHRRNSVRAAVSSQTRQTESTDPTEPELPGQRNPSDELVSAHRSEESSHTQPKEYFCLLSDFNLLRCLRWRCRCACCGAPRPLGGSVPPESRNPTFNIRKKENLSSSSHTLNYCDVWIPASLLKDGR